MMLIPLSIPLELFLLRTMCLPQHQRSSRRFKLKIRRLRPHKFEYPKDRDDFMLVMPETSIADVKFSKPVFLHRFTPMAESDDLLNPAINTVIKFQSSMKIEGKQNLQELYRTIKSPEWGNLIMTRHLTSYVDHAAKQLLAEDCTIEYNSSYSYLFKRKGVVLHLARIGISLLPTKSDKPIDVLLGTMHFYTYHVPIKPNQKMALIAQMIAECLRYFLIELDTLNKKVCAWRCRESSEAQKEHERRLLQRRIDVMEAIINFASGPVKVLTPASDPEGLLAEFFYELKSKLVATQTSIKYLDLKKPSLEELFDWDLCTLAQSSHSWWKWKLKKLDEQAQDEFLARVKTFIDSYYPGAIDPEFIFPKKYLLIANHLAKELSSRNFLIPFSVRTRPSFELVWSVSSPGRINKKAIGDPDKLISLAPTISTCANSFKLPRRQREDPHSIEITRNQYMLKGQIAGSSWNYEIITSKDPGNSKFANRFVLTKPEVWRTYGSLALPKESGAAEGVASPWDCFAADFSLDRMFLLCATKTELVLIMFDPFSPQRDKGMKTLAVESCFQCSMDQYIERVRFFYQELHDPYRSDTFTWVKSSNTLLTATMFVSDPDHHDGKVAPCLILTAVSTSEDELKFQEESLSMGQEQWHYVPPKTDEKTEMDCRNLLNLRLHFSWRQFAGRTIGVWLRYPGQYIIFEKKADGFILCCQNGAAFNFPDYFMTELIPTTPGLAGSSPILFRRNNTIKLEANSCSFELFELMIKLN